MQEWNVVVTVREGGFARVFRLLDDFGPISKTEYFNVLVMRVGNILNMMDGLLEKIDKNPEVLDCIARVIPVTRTFGFQSPEEFETGAKEIVLSWAPLVEGKGFHVRMRRRGFKGRISSQEEERRLAAAILDSLGESGSITRVEFEDPDVVIAVETLGGRAGLSLWTREDLRKYPFLRFDAATKTAAGKNPSPGDFDKAE